MARDDFLAVVETLGGWDGFEIARWTTEEALEPDAFGVPAKRLMIELRATRETRRSAAVGVGSRSWRSTMSRRGACAICR